MPDNGRRWAGVLLLLSVGACEQSDPLFPTTTIDVRSGVGEVSYDCPDDVAPEDCVKMEEARKDSVRALFTWDKFNFTGDCLMIYAEVEALLQEDRFYEYPVQSAYSGWWWKRGGVSNIGINRMNFMYEYRDTFRKVTIHEASHSFYNTEDESMPYFMEEACTRD